MDNSFESQIENNGFIAWTNVGISMMPLIRQGKDVMIIEKLKKNVKRFDAVLYIRPGVTGRGKYIMHRVLKVLPDDKFFIAGDNCTDGEIVEGKNIIGILTSVNRDGKQLDFKNKKYRLYINSWIRFYHIRFFILKIRNLCVNLKIKTNKLIHKLYLIYKGL